MGYTSNLYIDSPVQDAIYPLSADRKSGINTGIFVFYGHANSGSAQFGAGTNGATYLTGIKAMSTTYFPIRGKEMNNCKMAFFIGCYTADGSRAQDYGVLTVEAIKAGAEYSFGFMNTVEVSACRAFTSTLFRYLSEGYGIVDALNKTESGYTGYNDVLFNVLLSRNNLYSEEENYVSPLSNQEIEKYTFDRKTGETDLYVKYINGIQTGDFYKVNSYGQIVSYHNEFSEEDEAEINEKMAEFSHLLAVPFEVIPDDKIIDMGTEFNYVKKDTEKIVWAKVEDEIVAVKLVNSIYSSNDGNIIYQTKYYNLETQQEIPAELIQ